MGVERAVRPFGSDEGACSVGDHGGANGGDGRGEGVVGVGGDAREQVAGSGA